jgi:integrase
MNDEQNNLLPVPMEGRILNKTSNQLAKVREKSRISADYVPHLDINQVRALIETAKKNRNGDRDGLLIQTIFDGCFRCSEAISIRPKDIGQSESGWQIQILGEGNRRSVVAVTGSLIALLQAYAYRKQILPESRIFPINRNQTEDGYTQHNYNLIQVVKTLKGAQVVKKVNKRMVNW